MKIEDIKVGQYAFVEPWTGHDNESSVSRGSIPNEWFETPNKITAISYQRRILWFDDGTRCFVAPMDKVLFVSDNEYDLLLYMMGIDTKKEK